jgi:hypothetical protein
VIPTLSYSYILENVVAANAAVYRSNIPVGVAAIVVGLIMIIASAANMNSSPTTTSTTTSTGTSTTAAAGGPGAGFIVLIVIGVLFIIFGIRKALQAKGSMTFYMKPNGSHLDSTSSVTVYFPPPSIKQMRDYYTGKLVVN